MVVDGMQWKDPKGIRHTLARRRGESFYVNKVEYVTGCGHVLTVDDVHKKTLDPKPPTCMKCVVAPLPGA